MRSRNYFYMVILVAALILSFDVAIAGVFFEDDFETGDTSRVGKDGSKWTSKNAGKGGDSVTVSSKNAHSGKYSLKFHFAGGAISDDAFAEQRFKWGSARKSFYMRFYIYFPDGKEPWGENRYVHRDDPNGPDNNKLFRIWDSKNDYNGHKWGAYFQDASSGHSKIHAKKSDACSGSTSIGGASFPMESNDLGRWIRFEFYVKADSGAGDGVWKFWFDNAPKNSPTLAKTNVDVAGAPCYPNDFKYGYILGWANSGFSKNTNIYIDDVVFSDSYIGPVDGYANQDPEGPSPPKNLKVLN